MAEPIRAPPSSTGVITFYDQYAGGPLLDPKLVVIGTTVFILLELLLKGVRAVG
jgi:preprotein translocase subunit Sec61beta